MSDSTWREEVYRPSQFSHDEQEYWKRIKFAIFERDNYRCQACHKRARRDRLTAHHIIPRREGGGDDFDNLVALHYDCHDLIEAAGIRTLIEIKNFFKTHDKNEPGADESVFGVEEKKRDLGPLKNRAKSFPKKDAIIEQKSASVGQQPGLYDEKCMRTIREDVYRSKDPLARSVAILNEKYKLLKTWKRVGEFFGINEGTARHIALEGYKPKGPELCKKLGLATPQSMPTVRNILMNILDSLNPSDYRKPRSCANPFCTVHFVPRSGNQTHCCPACTKAHARWKRERAAAELAKPAKKVLVLP